MKIKDANDLKKIDRQTNIVNVHTCAKSGTFRVPLFVLTTVHDGQTYIRTNEYTAS